MVKRFTVDLKDRKILAILDWDARATNTSIAKEIKLSKKAVEYRIKKLESEGIICGYYPVIDFMKMGYGIYRIFMKLKGENQKVRERIEDYVKKDKRIKWSLWMGDNYAIGFDIWSKSVVEVKEVFMDFNKKFGEYISYRVFGVSAKAYHYPYRFLLGRVDKRMMLVSESDELVEIDELDRKILKELVKNSRQNLVGLGKKVGCGYKTVANRLKSLKERGILLGTRALIEPEALGYKWYKLLLNFENNIGEAYNKSDSFFKNLLETIYVVDYMGEEDYDVELAVKSTDDFFKIIERLKEELGRNLKSYSYIRFLKTIKISYLPNL